MSSRYESRTRSEINRYTAWVEIERDAVPPAVQELLDPMTVSAVVIEHRPNHAIKYRRKQATT